MLIPNSQEFPKSTSQPGFATYYLSRFFQESEENPKSTSQPGSARTTYSDFFLKTLSQPVNHLLRAIHKFFFLECWTKSNYQIFCAIFFSKSTSQLKFATHKFDFSTVLQKKCNIFTLSQPINHSARHTQFFFFGKQTVRSTKSVRCRPLSFIFT